MVSTCSKTSSGSLLVKNCLGSEYFLCVYGEFFFLCMCVFVPRCVYAVKFKHIRMVSTCSKMSSGVLLLKNCLGSEFLFFVCVCVCYDVYAVKFKYVGPDLCAYMCVCVCVCVCVCSKD
jgi:hypothetical protein